MNAGGGDWYQNHGAAMNPARIPSGMPQNGGQNPTTVINNFYGAGGMATSQMMGTGGHQGGMLQNAMQMLGALAPDTFGAFLPTGGSFSPMGQAMMMQQQQEMQSVMKTAGTFDEQHYTAMMNRVNSQIFGPGNPLAAMATSRDEASKLLGVLNSTGMQMAQNMIPGLRGVVETFNPLGSTSSAMAGAIYAGSRHLGATVDDVNRMTEALSTRYMSNTSRGAGLPDSSFTYGLNQREIGEVAGSMMGAYLLDPHQLSGDNAMGGESSQFAQNMTKYNAAAASLKDIFGPQGSVTKLFAQLNTMTSGGLSQLSAGEISGFVDKMKIVTLNSGMTVQGMTALVGQNSMFATQMGHSGMVGANVALNSMTLTNSLLQSRGMEPVWGQADNNQVGNELNQALLATVSSSRGVAGMGLLRLERDVNAAGGPIAGGEEAFTRLQKLNESIRSGELTSDQIQQLGNVQGLAGWTSSLMPGGVASARDYLTNVRMNGEFSGEFGGASYSLVVDAAAREAKSALAFNSDVAAYAKKKGMKSGDMADKIFGILTDKSLDTEESIIGALENELRPTYGDKGAAIMAKSMYSSTNGTLWAWGAPGDLGFDMSRGRDSALLQLKENERLVKEESFWSGTGIGRQGAMGQRLMRVLTGEGKSSMKNVVGAIMGAPSDEESLELARSLGGGRIEEIGGVMSKLNAARKAGETTITGDLLYEVLDMTGKNIADLKLNKEFAPFMDLQKAIGGVGDELAKQYLPGGSLDLLATARTGKEMDKRMGGLKWVLDEKNNASPEGITDQVQKVLDLVNSKDGKALLASIADETGMPLEYVEKDLRAAANSKTAAFDLRGWMEQYGEGLTSKVDIGVGGVIKKRDAKDGYEVSAIDPRGDKSANFSIARFLKSTFEGQTVFNNAVINTVVKNPQEGTV